MEKLSIVLPIRLDQRTHDFIAAKAREHERSKAWIIRALLMPYVDGEPDRFDDAIAARKSAADNEGPESP